VEQDVDWTAGPVALRFGLKDPEMDSPEGPLLALVDPLFGEEAPAPFHRPGHCIEASFDVLDVGSAHNSE
jgi:hypothetical protein